MPTRYVYVPRSLKGGDMSTPTHFADFNPVSLSYSPLVPVVSETTHAPIPVTEQAAAEIESTNPLGRIVSVTSDYARQAAANPDFNALMGVLAQYLIASAANKLTQPPPQPKSWLQRTREYLTTSPAERARQQQKAAFSKGQYITAAAPFIGRIANSFIPGTGEMIKDGLLSLGKRIGWGRRGGKLRRRRKPGKPIFRENKITGKRKKIGTTANLQKDVKEVAKEAFAEKLEKKHGRERTKEFVDDVFDSPRWIATLADLFAHIVSWIRPEWGLAAKTASSVVKAGDNVYNTYKSNRREETKKDLDDLRNTLKNNLPTSDSKIASQAIESKGSGMRGGRRRSTLNGFSSQREKMAWVRSFRKKRRGSGYKGGSRRRRHRRRHGGGKGSIYKYYASSNPFRFKSRRHKRRGRGLRGGDMVDSGWLGIGDPDNPSYKFLR